MSQIELDKQIIQRYFEAYNNKNEAIFDEIIAPDYVDHGQTAYMGSPGRGVAGAKNDLKNSLDKLDDLNYMVEAISLHNLSSRNFLLSLYFVLVSQSMRDGHPKKLGLIKQDKLVIL